MEPGPVEAARPGADSEVNVDWVLGWKKTKKEKKKKDAEYDVPDDGHTLDVPKQSLPIS